MRYYLHGGEKTSNKNNPWQPEPFHSQAFLNILTELDHQIFIEFWWKLGKFAEIWGGGCANLAYIEPSYFAKLNLAQTVWPQWWDYGSFSWQNVYKIFKIHWKIISREPSNPLHHLCLAYNLIVKWKIESETFSSINLVKPPWSHLTLTLWIFEIFPSLKIRCRILILRGIWVMPMLYN